MKMNDPLISVIVPVYKVEKYLDKCVQSLLAQNYQNIEIILVDDGSPDKCPQICDNYANENVNIRALHKPNGGLGSARNYGTEHANGDWIVFVDSDDYVSPDYVSYMWKLCKEYDADMVSCGITQVDESGAKLSQSPNKSIKVLNGKEAVFQVYFARTVGHRSYSKIIKKEQILNHPFPDGYFEDFATTYLWLHECNTVVIGDGASNYSYVQRSGSILNSKLNPKHLHAFEICDDVKLFIEKNYPEYSKYCALLYSGQEIQILNRQNMTDEEFSKIYCRYRAEFRKNLFDVLWLKGLNTRKKATFVSLCLTPGIYKLIRSNFGKRQK